ncbi:hypothetical protein QTO34_012816 [Cnephaeus nilssonii]|uniref:Uncharacterized protein n=1 Tax=Cnephaeus nilssonii TaxID=3371016 RepID=A0AA40HA38_CNENI|nr:hypothetical protein QTO34_012816 [Eptesicus nilssonii]
MEEIVELQEAAQKYQIELEEQFRAWFLALERLRENERYVLSASYGQALEAHSQAKELFMMACLHEKSQTSQHMHNVKSGAVQEGAAPPVLGLHLVQEGQAWQGGSTVHATITQFNHVATCLGDSSMMAQGRANVVEHWIKVAKVC